jgi:sulfate transport system substrate-binding protein
MTRPPDSPRAILSADPTARRFRILFGVVLAALFVIALLVAGPPRWAPQVHTVNLYCFTGLEEPMRIDLLPAFRARYEEETGRRIELITTFAGSGYITRQVVREFPVDVAILSSNVDAIYAAAHGVRDRGDTLPRGGVVTTSPLVIVTRPGNPLGIFDWEDLARDDVAIVHPDPTTSGAGVWSILAQYAAIERRRGEGGAVEHLRRMRERVVSWPASAGTARAVFAGGDGDVLVTYEHEVRGDDVRQALAGELVYPDPTILTEHVAVRVARSGATREQLEIVDALLAFLWSEQAGAIFASYGLERLTTANDVAQRSAAIGAELLTLQSLGGAATARREILERIWYGEVQHSDR